MKPYFFKSLFDKKVRSGSKVTIPSVIQSEREKFIEYPQGGRK